MIIKTHWIFDNYLISELFSLKCSIINRSNSKELFKVAYTDQKWPLMKRGTKRATPTRIKNPKIIRSSIKPTNPKIFSGTKSIGKIK